MKQVQIQIDELRRKIEYHSNRYYNMDDPEITDYEYDMLMQQLKKIEKEHPEFVTPDSPTQKVGGTAKRTAGVLVRHNVPMLSLQDARMDSARCRPGFCGRNAATAGASGICGGI